ncbi:MAG: baseplate assembly protein [Shimia sp.]
MTGFAAIDLPALPAPEVLEEVVYEQLLEEMKAEAVLRHPDLANVIELESEPAVKILQVAAYFRMLDWMRFNDGVRACFLSHATGADLDNLAAFWGVARLEVAPARPDERPPVAAVMEEDAGFRRRVQLSLEGHSTAGPAGAYLFWTLSSDGRVKDANVESPAPGEVVVTVLSSEGDGTPTAELLAIVSSVLNDDEVRPLTDHVTVQPPVLTTFDINATLTLYPGPDATIVADAARSALASYLDAQARLGRDVTRAGIIGALVQPGVQNVDLVAPVADIVVAASEVAFAEQVNVAIGGRDV